MKRDPYQRKEKWIRWKLKNTPEVTGVSKPNSEIILSFLNDMELGKNISPGSKRGGRSPVRLLRVKGSLLFFAKHFPNKSLDKISKNDIHQLFHDMREGLTLKDDEKPYIGVGEFVKDFKAFWKWLVRTERVEKDITLDLRTSDGRKPDWVYLTEDQFRILANQARGDYRALIWFMYDTGSRVTEAYSIRISDFSNDFTQLNIRNEYAKTFGRIIKLKLCSALIREHVKVNNLQPSDFIFDKRTAAFNKYLRTHAGRMFGDSESPARKQYNKMSLYDIRHNACCYWLKRYQKTRSLMYRMGWSEEKEVKYYSELLGLSDDIDDDDMVISEDKSRYEKRINELERDRDKVSDLVKELISKIGLLQGEVGEGASLNAGNSTK